MMGRYEYYMHKGLCKQSHKKRLNLTIGVKSYDLVGQWAVPKLEIDCSPKLLSIGLFFACCMPCGLVETTCLTNSTLPFWAKKVG